MFQIVLSDATLDGRGGPMSFLVMLDHDEWHDLETKLRVSRDPGANPSACVFSSHLGPVFDVRCVIAIVPMLIDDEDMPHGEDDDGGGDLEPPIPGPKDGPLSKPALGGPVGES